ncbi:Epoxyqueuosine reductase [Anoxybacillus sp. BCO1]|nr:Epoxyqueuosine reductase [Anoxybacillus sp. BCO1]
MDVEALKEEIIQYSRTIGIDKIGFASADPFFELKERLRQQQQLGYQSGFEEPDIEKRTTPSLLLPEARSIIAIALAYPSKLKNAPRSTKKERRGIFVEHLGGEITTSFCASGCKN